MAQRASFREIAVAAKEQERKRANIQGIMSEPSLDYTIEIGVTTYKEDENGENIVEYFKSPLVDKLGEVSTLVESNRAGGVASGIYKVIGARLTPEMIRNNLRETYMIITVSVGYEDFKDELVFGLDAGRNVKVIFEEILVRILRVLNMSKTKDELQVKWWLMKTMLSGRIPKGKEGNQEYAHGYSVSEKGLYSNRVHGYNYKLSVLMGNTTKTSSRYENVQTTNYKQTDVEWTLTNYILKNLEVISNTKFQMIDTRTRKGTFFGVKYEVGFRDRVGGEQLLRQELEIRWGFNKLEYIKVILLDFMPKLMQSNKEIVKQLTVPYKSGQNNYFEYIRRFDYSNLDVDDELLPGNIRLPRIATDIGIYKTVNYKNLFSRYDKGIGREYSLGITFEDGRGERIDKLDRQALGGNYPVYAIRLKCNSAELFQFLYVHDIEFKRDVDNYFKSYKLMGLDLFLEVLSSMRDYNLTDILVDKFRPDIEGREQFDLPF